MGAFGQIARKDILKALWNRGPSSAFLQDIFATRAKGKNLFNLSWGIKSSIFYISLQLKQKGKILSFTLQVSVFLVDKEGNGRPGNMQLLSLLIDTLANIIKHMNG